MESNFYMAFYCRSIWGKIPLTNTRRLEFSRRQFYKISSTKVMFLNPYIQISIFSHIAVIVKVYIFVQFDCLILIQWQWRRMNNRTQQLMRKTLCSATTKDAERNSIQLAIIQVFLILIKLNQYFKIPAFSTLDLHISMMPTKFGSVVRRKAPTSGFFCFFNFNQ